MFHNEWFLDFPVFIKVEKLPNTMKKGNRLDHLFYPLDGNLSMAAADFVPGNEVISVNFLTRRFRLRDQNKECSQLLRQGYACFSIKPLAWFISSLIFWEQTSGATVRQGLLFYQIIVEFNV